MPTRLVDSRAAAAWPRSSWRPWLLLVLLIQSACATGVPRGNLLTGTRDGVRTFWRTPTPFVTLAPSSDFASVRVSDMEWRAAFTELILAVPLRVAVRVPKSSAGRLVRASWLSGATGADTVERGYARLCERRGSPGDCFWLLGDDSPDPRLNLPGRFALALHLALTPTVEAALGVIRDASADALTTLLTGLSLYLVVLMAPEPISKGLAVTMTLFLWGYLGSELWGLVSATRQLWEEVETAPTFQALHDASERYAQVLGPNTLRILILLATWKAGATGEEAITGSRLPGFPGVMQRAAIASGVQLPPATSQVAAVSVFEGKLILTLPSGAGALLAMQQQADGEEGDIHHIATVENEKSTSRGGPWTPLFKRFFEKAGLSMQDEANKVRIPGHKGPHPKAYHEYIHQRLKTALADCETTMQCREALLQELGLLAKQLKHAGSEFNKLVTRTP